MKIKEKNGCKISDFTLGTVQLGMEYGINNKDGMPSFEKSSKILKTALDFGVKSFDTAKGYGKSEQVLGRFFSATDSEKTIITKVLFGDETKNEIKKRLYSDVEDSLKVLGIEKIPFLMLHREAYIEQYGDALSEAMKSLKSDGLVGNIGVSFSNKDNLEPLLDCDVYDCIQIPMNLWDNKEIQNGTVKKIADSGVMIFARSMFLQGMFFKDPKELLGTKFASAVQELEKLNKISEKSGKSIQELAMGYIRDAEGIASLVIGAETPEQVSENVKLFETARLEDELREELTESFSDVDPYLIRPWEWNAKK